MRPLSHAEIIGQFGSAMQNAGLEAPTQIHADGQRHRFRCKGDKANNSWYRLHTDGIPAGAFGCWKRGISETWRADIGRDLTTTEQTSLRERQAAIQREREAEQAKHHAEARAKAAQLLAKAGAPKTKHPYLVAKKVRAYGLQQLQQQLVIPVRDQLGELHGLQFIEPDGRKVFLTGTAKAGHFHLIGDAQDLVIVAEGYATGATIHEATGQPVAVAFDAGNLRPVAAALQAWKPGMRLVVAADNDHRTEGNPGLTKGQEAAQACAGSLWAPDFAEGDSGTDWNDYALQHGLQAVAQAFQAHARDAEPERAGTTENAPQAQQEAPAAASKRAQGPRFTVDDRAVWFHGADKDGAPLPAYRVCPPLRVLALLRDTESENWGLLLEFDDQDGISHRWALPWRMFAGAGDEMRAELLRLGFFLPPLVKNRNLVMEYLSRAHPAERARSVERTGWHDRSYVLPDRTIGTASEPVYFQTEGTRDRPYTTRGELGAWRTDVADLCRGNSRLMFPVSAAFASMLLPWAEEESGGFHLRSASSSGKTTALRVAASVFGGESYMRRWRATDNALEAIASIHNDALLILDELAQVDPKIAGAAAYMLGNGEGKQRAYRTGAGRPVLRWRLLFFSAGEVSLAEHMRQDGKRAQAGQEARLAEIPADAGAGRGVFEDLHGYADGAAFSRALLAGVAQSHGTAAPAFIVAVQPLLDELPQQLREERQRFCREVLSEHSADGQAWRVATRFALVASAGELATCHGITGWEEGEAWQAAQVCFRAWLDQRGGASNLEPARMVSQVRHFLERFGESRFQPWVSDDHGKWTTNNRAGFRSGGDGMLDAAETTYYLLPETFRKEVCEGYDYHDVLRALDAHGALKRDKTSRKFARRERLPGLGLAQCYVITPRIWATEPAQQQGAAEGDTP